MGLLDSITDIVSDVGSALGDFAGSSVGKSLMSFIPGGSMISSLLEEFGQGGGMMNMFSSVLDMFGDSDSSFLSKTGLETVSAFVDKASDSGDLKNLAKKVEEKRSLNRAELKKDQVDSEIATQNLFEMFASRQAAQVADAA